VGKHRMKIGIIGAMPQEVELVRREMINPKEQLIGGRTFITGSLYGQETTLVFSRWGKVAAAITATTLINQFNVDFVLFTGVAGAVSADLNIGDVVISDNLYQHDLDARPIFPQYQIPLTDIQLFKPLKNHTSLAKTAATNYLNKITEDISECVLNKFSIANPKAIKGTIATGDQFIENAATHPNMLFSPDQKADAVEMEGASVAQVCQDFGKHYVVIRTISDKADHSATVDFQAFISEVSNHYSRGIVKHFFEQLHEEAQASHTKITSTATI
jgi:adenosylhomocysteine nucleosidase